MLTGRLRLDDRGASLVASVMAMVAILGFGAVALEAVENHHDGVERTRDADRVALAAEFAASEGAARVMDGDHLAFTGTGTLEGVDYSYAATPTGDGRWTVVGRAGSGRDERVVEADLRRDEQADGAVVPQYALWADQIRVRWSSGVIDGLIGAAERIDIRGDALASEQHLLAPDATCRGCDNPVSITEYIAPALPATDGATACPADGRGRIRNTTVAAGTYRCGGTWLRFRGTVTLDGPVVFVLDPGTRLDVRNTDVNAGGSPDDLQIVKPTTTTTRWSRFDDASFVGHITMPGTRLLVDDDVSWDGRIAVGYANLRRITADVEVATTMGAAEDRYAVWTEALLDIGWVRSGDVDGPVGSRDRIRYWYSHAIGTTQDVVAGGTCSNCPNPVTIDDYATLPLPDPSGAASCPANGSYRLTGPIELGGDYLCDRAWSTLRISGEITVSGPTVIHVGSNTRIDIRNATLNPDGDSANLLIVQATTTGWAYRAVIDDSTMYGRILTPETWWYVGDVAWRGLFEVESWWLYDWANIDGAWDGGGPGTVTITWHIDRWQLS